MTDNELTAKVGRLLFDERVESVGGASTSWLIRAGEHGIHGWSPHNQQVEPTEFAIGVALAAYNRAYATDSRWVGPIIEAAAEKGIIVTLGKEPNMRDGTPRRWVADTDGGIGIGARHKHESLARVVCRAVVSAMEQKEGGK